MNGKEISTVVERVLQAYIYSQSGLAIPLLLSGPGAIDYSDNVLINRAYKPYIYIDFHYDEKQTFIHPSVYALSSLALPSSPFLQSS